MTQPDHQSRLVRVQRGDRDAFDSLAIENRRRLEAFIARRVHPELRERLDLDDLTQETFTRAFESIASFRGDSESAWFAWVSGIAKHIVLDAIRRQRGATGKTLQLDHEPCADGVSPSRALRREERFDRLRDAIRALPGDYRQVVQWCRLDGVRIREVAERMGRSPDAVKKLLWRAVRKLEEDLGDTDSLGLPMRELEVRESREAEDDA